MEDSFCQVLVGGKDCSVKWLMLRLDAENPW